jgi:class 3 adenylate cyclase
MQRRLAAILAADVAGYSRLMERDEAGTLEALKSRRRNVLAPLLAQHHGRIVKVMGDGVLVEFGSAVNAVQCAVDLQRRMDEANAAGRRHRGLASLLGEMLPRQGTGEPGASPCRAAQGRPASLMQAAIGTLHGRRTGARRSAY